MHKLVLYVSLILAYLGLSKLLSPSELGMDYISNEAAMSKVFPGENVSAILLDMHATGFFMDTYYQKYRLVYNFQSSEEVIVRTSKNFAKKNKHHIGLSLFRRIDGLEEIIPMPPGSEYVGKKEFGEWVPSPQGGLVWKFFKAYKNLPLFLGWGEWTPTPAFVDAVKQAHYRQLPFFGVSNEFGSQGEITRQQFPDYFKKDRQNQQNLKTLLFSYFQENFR
jgi:hypothetical protein